MVAQEALEADGAETVLAEGLDFLGLMDFALGLHKLTDLVVPNAHSELEVLVLRVGIKLSIKINES